MMVLKSVPSLGGLANGADAVLLVDEDVRSERGDVVGTRTGSSR
jgi:hypothetical protein